MHHRLQSDMRENPASDRRHGSRLAVGSVSNVDFNNNEISAPTEPSAGHSHPLAIGVDSPHAAPPHAATAEEYRHDGRLMTVHEVAELLQVPSSWVYEHTRQRCLNRLPGIRLGKYWRFERADILRWIDANRKKDYQRVG
jgi:excisionase family DNA binding protein